jgi:3-oxo-4-pregnene-20-carboxyl-CoA dehydrogenase beta subunit
MSVEMELPSDEERSLLRDAVQGLLQAHWPLDDMEESQLRAQDPSAIRDLYTALASQGITTLGANPAEGGLREILVVTELMGRFCAPIPLLGAVIANIALASRAADERQLQAFIQQMHVGDAIASVVFGALDGDRNSGAVSLENGRISGRVRYVEGVAAASHLLVFTQKPLRLLIVETGALGVEVTTTPGLAVPPLAEVRFEHTPAVVLDIDSADAQALNLVARLCMVARALGAAKRGFELVTDYAKERQQFGQPIGRFQAVQHKLADNLICLEGVRLTLEYAARTYDFGDASWREYGLAAHAFASTELRQVALENHHVFGAIGYSEEHEAPHQFRRIHADLTCFGGSARSREELACFLIDQSGEMPDYDLGEQGNCFRQEVRQWLAENWVKNEGEQDSGAFALAAAEQGYFSVTWPQAFGGRGSTPMEQMAFMEELERVEAPSIVINACEIQAHGLMQFGSKAQQAYFIPKIARGELQFCLGYSEPGSGSDLASLKTTAVLDGDEWVINGQKIWTTLAETADYMWLAARTDPNAKVPHAGISVFLVPMDSPGITIRPSMAMYGQTFCQEFLDNVRVPKDALVGELNGGWKVLTAALATERMIMGGYVAKVRCKFNYLLEAVRKDSHGVAKDSAARNSIGLLAAEIEVARQLITQATKIAEAGQVPAHEASMSGVFNSELMERLGEAALDILGTSAILEEGAKGASPGGLEQMLRHSIMMVVGGGTNEIQRNLIAQRGLGLPR